VYFWWAVGGVLRGEKAGGLPGDKKLEILLQMQPVWVIIIKINA